MTPAQLATFKAAINGDANIAAAVAAGDDGAIASYYNAPGTGTIWLPSISIGQLNTAIVWSEFITLTVAKQNGYLALIQGPIDATNLNIRNGFSAIFTGTTTLANLTALAQRVPTRFEALFTTSSVCALFGQQATVENVVLALNS